MRLGPCLCMLLLQPADHKIHIITTRWALAASTAKCKQSTWSVAIYWHVTTFDSTTQMTEASKHHRLGSQGQEPQRMTVCHKTQRTTQCILHSCKLAYSIYSNSNNNSNTSTAAVRAVMLQILNMTHWLLIPMAELLAACCKQQVG